MTLAYKTRVTQDSSAVNPGKGPDTQTPHPLRECCDLAVMTEAQGRPPHPQAICLH